jgi:hypothetical protein
LYDSTVTSESGVGKAQAVWGVDAGEVVVEEIIDLTSSINARVSFNVEVQGSSSLKLPSITRLLKDEFQTTNKGDISKTTQDNRPTTIPHQRKRRL